MSTQYRIGIIGTGRIASRFIVEAATVENVSVVAVYNPNIISAERFSKEKGLKRAASLADLFDMVDIVYVASPHDSHVDYVKSALLAGKHVLCEKPMAFSASDAIELYELADKKSLVLMEAVKTACFPGFKKLLEVAKSGVIGDIKFVDATFTKLVSAEGRELGNCPYRGSFFELGSYGLLPVVSLLGDDVKDVSFDCIRNANDTDIFTKATIRYDNAFANVACGLGVKSEGKLVVAGTLGYILVPAPWWLTRDFEVHFEDPNKVDYYHEPLEGDGLRYEIMELVNLIEADETDKNQVRSLTKYQSIAMAKVMGDFYRSSYREWRE